MEMVNATIDLDVSRLNIPRRACHGVQGHVFVAKLVNAPDDVTGLYFRLFRPNGNGAYFDIKGIEHEDGSWTVKIPSGCLLNVGLGSYEVHATFADDDKAGLGKGQFEITPYTFTTSPDDIPNNQTVTTMPCEGGGVAQVVLVWDGFEYVMKTTIVNTEDAE